MGNASSASCGCLVGLGRNRNLSHNVHGHCVGSQKTQLGNKKLPCQAQAWASPVPLGEPSEVERAEPLGIDMSIRVAPENVPTKKNETAWGVRLDVDSKLRRPDVLLASPSRFQVEQLLASPGSLPQPLAPSEHARVIQKILPTATHDMLVRLPSELLEARSVEAQVLRRKLVHGTTVVFLTAGYEGKRFVFERASELGIKTVVMDHPDSWARGLVDEGIISKFIPIDMCQPSDQVMKESLELIRGLGKDGVTGRADAICTFVELSVSLVARLCELLGLPGPLPDAVDKARNKHATRAALKANGLPVPKNSLIHSEADLDQVAEYVGFPAVLKPISGAASLGVKKVVKKEDLLTCYREVVAELSSLVVVSGALVQADSSNQGILADRVIDMTMLLEQYLDGDEVDVDVVMSDGEWRFASVTDNGPTVEPYFNETWGVCPSLLPVDQQRELKKLAVQSVEALGFSEGVFHVECKYTSTGPHLIEVNARMGGGPVHEHNLRTWGVDLVEETLFIALGIPARPMTPQVPLEATAFYNWPAQNSGSVELIPRLAELEQEDGGVIWAKPIVHIGDKVVGPEDGMPTWLCQFFVAKPTAKEAVDFLLGWPVQNPFQIKS